MSLDRLRYLLGAACVALTAAIVVIHVPRVVSSFDSQVQADAYITSAETRLTTTGDALGISHALQVAALADIPRSSTYVLLLPTGQQADGAGLSSLTLETVGPFMQYLLLPAEPTTSAAAHYVICYACDLRAWRRPTRWLWSDGPAAIGRVEG